MKSCFKNCWLAGLLAFYCGLVNVSGQTFKTLHVFDGFYAIPHTNTDGGYPSAPLIQFGNALVGTTQQGGDSSQGVTFKVNNDGTGFTTLHNFGGIPAYTSTNTEGASPCGALILSGNRFYGTAQNGGRYGRGTVFAINTDGTGFSTLHSFTDFSGFNTKGWSTNSDGANPYCSLVLSGGTLYGTTPYGGTLGGGTVFALSTNGTGFKIVHTFTGGSDGTWPVAGLILSDDKLYGVARNGGDYDNGTVFTLNTNGTGFTTLYSFSVSSGDRGTNSDGIIPLGGVIRSGNILYGTAYEGGTFGAGTVFAVNTDGSGFINLHSFTGGSSDGGYPSGQLILSGNTLYGTGYAGGSSDNGTVFAVNTEGAGFTILHSFTGDTNGAFPSAGLILSRNTLYGTTAGGGYMKYGTVFSLSFAPQLTTFPSGSNVTLRWPINYVGFDYTAFALQSSTNLASPFWDTNLPAPVIVNGQYTVTSPISGAQQFFRLSQ